LSIDRQAKEEDDDDFFSFFSCSCKEYRFCSRAREIVVVEEEGKESVLSTHLLV